jgi:hypothetical protein
MKNVLQAVHIAIIVSATLTFISCIRDTVVHDDEAGWNQPAVVNTTNAFTFSVDAHRFAYISRLPVVFTSDSLALVLVVSAYARGSAVITVVGEGETIIRSDTIASNRMRVTTMVTGRVPVRIEIALQAFTGKIVFMLAGYGSDMTFPVAAFPSRRGSSWTYAVYDSIARQADTLVVTILRDTIYSGVVSSIWRLAYRARVDSQHVIITNDTVRIAPSERSYLITKYVFPFRAGARWQGDFATQTSIVAQIGPIVSGHHSFARAFNVVETWSLLNDRGNVSTWLVPGIGIVKRHREQAGFSVVNSTWELLSFSIPE